MEKAVSTETSRPEDRPSRRYSSPREGKLTGCSSARRTFHAVLDPVIGIEACRRVHALGGKAHDVDDFGLVLLLVEAIGAVSRLRDALVPVADGELDPPRGAFEFDALERSRHFVGGRLGVAFPGLFVG